MLSVQPTGAAPGTGIMGVNLAAGVDDATFASIVDAWRKHEKSSVSATRADQFAAKQ